jgi:general secretion pathway protein G
MTMLDVFFVTKGRYPDASEGLNVLMESRQLPQLPLDPWGTPYRYSLEGGKPVVTSLGSDQAPGGSGSAADVTSPAR